MQAQGRPGTLRGVLPSELAQQDGRIKPSEEPSAPESPEWAVTVAKAAVFGPRNAPRGLTAEGAC